MRFICTPVCIVFYLIYLQINTINEDETKSKEEVGEEKFQPMFSSEKEISGSNAHFKIYHLPSLPPFTSSGMKFIVAFNENIFYLSLMLFLFAPGSSTIASEARG